MINDMNTIFRKGLYAPKVVKLLEGIDRAMQEERHIATVVSVTTTDICDKLFKEIRNTQPIRKEGRSIKYGQFSSEIANVKIMVIWRIDNFLQRNQEIRARNSFHVDVQRKELYANIITVQGGLNKSAIYEGIQHELSHLYEAIMGSGHLSSPKQYKRYAQANNNLSNSNQVQTSKMRDIKGVVSSVLYISEDYEQRAFANGAYQYLMQNTNDYFYNFDNAIQETKLFQILANFSDYYVFIKELGPYDNDLQNEIKQYKGLSYNKLINLCLRTKRNLERLLAQVKEKAIQDTRRENMFEDFQVYELKPQ